MPEPEFTIEGVLHNAVEYATGEVFNEPIAQKIIEVLARGGYVIVPATEALLEKGKEVGKLHD